MNRRHVISWAAFACLPPVAAQPAASAAPDRRDWLENFGPARQPWIDKLRSLRQGRAEVFRIVQIGDSHTAGDFFTGGQQYCCRLMSGIRNLGLLLRRQNFYR